jgi:hypothetical protein
MPYLVIEDFGTRGLCGRVDQETDREPGSLMEHKDFFYFWRNIGRSRKQDIERGRWGLGKTVFPATSLINSFFGLTVRAEDGRPYLMGQSVLKIHTIRGERYCPYGFFADTGADEFQRPFSDAARLNDFRSDFQLQRRDEPGLSVVVPFPDADEIEPSQMVRSAILHYFYPIVRGELVVEVQGEGLHVVIDAGSIDTAVESVDWSETSHGTADLKRLFDFVRRVIPLEESAFVRLPEPRPPRAPDWSKGRFDDAVIQTIKRQFTDQGMLALRVPVTVKPKRGTTETTFFDVFIERDETLLKAEDHYIRQGITISRIQALREKGFRGLVVVEDRPLSTRPIHHS